MTGSLCKPLCVNKEIKIRKCLGHGVKPHVLEAEWKGVKIVLKMEQPSKHFMDFMPPVKNKAKFNLTRKDIIQYVSISIVCNYYVFICQHNKYFNCFKTEYEFDLI